jgi:hypothetical protein
VEQNRDLTNRNRIRGISGRTSGRLIAKSISINDQGCRSGRGAGGKAIELTQGGLRHVPTLELREPQGHLLVDSTGLKLSGAGEWLVEKHGTSRRRSWRKLHIGVDADTGGSSRPR